MKKLHLDSEYRNRYIKFYLVDGTIEDSRLKNWRQIAWNQVICLSAHLLNNVHQINCKGPGFKTFMNFRWGGEEAEYDKTGEYIGHKKIHIWTIGWTDGRLCFLEDIDFYTGQFIKEYTAPLSQFKRHLHPLVKGIDSGSCN